MPRLQLLYDLRLAPFSPLDHAALYREMLDQCAWADQHGFDAVVFGEHHGTVDGYLPSAVTAAAAVAGRTRNLKLRPMVMAPFRDPLALAEELAVVDLASGGRVTPIILAGYVQEEFDMFGVELSQRPKLIEECVETLKQAWTGEPFEFRGRRVRVTPRPCQSPRPTLVLGATSTPGARRAARIGDEFQAGEPGHWKTYVEACRELGREPGHRERSGPAFLFVTEDPEKSWPEVAPYVDYHTRAYDAWAHENYGYSSKVFRSAESLDALRTNPAYQVVTPDECVELAKRWHPDGALLFHALMAGLPPELSWSSLELFGQKVLPRLDLT